jgi:hypothetical protein
MNVYSDFTIPALGSHVTVYMAAISVAPTVGMIIGEEIIGKNVQRCRGLIGSANQKFPLRD